LDKSSCQNPRRFLQALYQPAAAPHLLNCYTNLFQNKNKRFEWSFLKTLQPVFLMKNHIHLVDWLQVFHVMDEN